MLKAVAWWFVLIFNPITHTLSHHMPLHSDFWSSQPDKLVKIRFSESGPSSERAETVLTMLEQTVVGYGEHVALAVKRQGEWQKWTYRKYQEDCMCLAKAMMEVQGILLSQTIFPWLVSADTINFAAIEIMSRLMKWLLHFRVSFTVTLLCSVLLLNVP